MLTLVSPSRGNELHLVNYAALLLYAITKWGQQKSWLHRSTIFVRGVLQREALGYLRYWYQMFREYPKTKKDPPKRA